jgi:antitoxin HicB
MRYPVTLTRDDNDTIMVTFPDVPGAITYGDTEEEALQRAPDALLTVIDALIKDHKDIPVPSEKRGPSIELPSLETAKIELYRTMRAGKIGKSELARRLDWHLPQVDRLLEMRHGSKLEQLDRAFSAMGKRLQVTVADVRVAYASRGASARPVFGGKRAVSARSTARRKSPRKSPQRHVSK